MERYGRRCIREAGERIKGHGKEMMTRRGGMCMDFPGGRERIFRAWLSVSGLNISSFFFFCLSTLNEMLDGLP